MPSDDLISTPAAGAELGVCDERVRQLVDEGELEAVRVAGRVLVRAGGVHAVAGARASRRADRAAEAGSRASRRQDGSWERRFGRKIAAQSRRSARRVEREIAVARAELGLAPRSRRTRGQR